MIVMALLLPVLARADPQRCAQCHSKQVEGYLKTGMGNSLSRPGAQPPGRFRHSRSGARVEVRTNAVGMRHRIEGGRLAAEYPIDYFVGSGNHGRSYLINVGGRLFQSPASYYTQLARWDVSPGYEADRELDFNRPVVPECLFCHSGNARPIRNSLNTYQSPPFESEAITCERCHGPAADHLVKPSPATILNPAKLAPERRDAVCEQCHLGAEARILNPGKQFSDYHPGELLEGTFSAYVFERRPDAPAGHALKVVSHVEQLAESACARESQGKMWCGSCHDPHDKPAEPVSYYRERCQQCHAAADLESHPKPAKNCIGCHMPRRNTYDGSHTAFTDHQIQRRPNDPGEPLQSKSLRPWRQPPSSLARRNLGLAHISVGERDQSAEYLNEGFRILAEVQPSFNDDPAVLTSLAAVLLKKNVPEEAAKLFQRAATLEPTDARHHLNLASALRAAGKNALAIESLEKAIALDPSLEDAHLLLAQIRKETGSPEQSRQALERYLEFMPQSLPFRRLLDER